MKFEAGYKMTLGEKPRHGYQSLVQWREHHYQGRYWPGRMERFLDRIETRQRYKVGPRPWSPGRYQTSKWQPYTGHGRFSGILDRCRHAYYSERYSGVRSRPEDYLIGRDTPEQIAADNDKRYWRQSWRMRSKALSGT